MTQHCSKKSAHFLVDVKGNGSEGEMDLKGKRACDSITEKCNMTETKSLKVKICTLPVTVLVIVMISLFPF